jgi:DNA-binding MurR/RpiR family transcriptional regulator
MVVADPLVLIPILREVVTIYPSLPPAERRVADVVLDRPRGVLVRTSSELAIEAGASQPAASRLCARLSTRTFAAFKVRLAQELGVESVSVSGDDETPGYLLAASPAFAASDGVDPLLASIVARTETDQALVLRAVATLDPDALRRAARALRTARTIVVCGFDLSGSVAGRLASLLHLAGCPARAERDPDSAPWLGDLAMHDVLLVISYRGRVPQLLGALGRIRAQGASVIVLTNEAQTNLADLADVLLLTRAPAARSDDEYVTGPALAVQLAATRALWLAVHAESSGN